MIRYTCNKKAYSDLSEECKTCVSRKECLSGKWCFVAEAEMPSMMDTAMPVLKDTRTITVTTGDGMSFDVSREDVKKNLEAELYKGLYSGLMTGGA